MDIRQMIWVTLFAVIVGILYATVGWWIAYVLERAFFMNISYWALVGICLAIWALIMFAIYMQYRRDERDERYE